MSEVKSPTASEVVPPAAKSEKKTYRVRTQNFNKLTTSAVEALKVYRAALKAAKEDDKTVHEDPSFKIVMPEIQTIKTTAKGEVVKTITVGSLSVMASYETTGGSKKAREAASKVPAAASAGQSVETITAEVVAAPEGEWEEAK